MKSTESQAPFTIAVVVYTLRSRRKLSGQPS